MGAQAHESNLMTLARESRKSNKQDYAKQQKAKAAAAAAKQAGDRMPLQLQCTHCQDEDASLKRKVQRLEEEYRNNQVCIF